MGIPSYYKRLIDRFPRLVKKGVRVETPTASDALYFDFNCLIYHCIRAPGMPTYTKETGAAWETALLETVKRYTVGVWTAAGRPKEVLISVDGVVPMAKIRQQRLRRFKSIWLAAKEVELGAASGDRWDTNAITPGTAFMERLTSELKELGLLRGWAVSGADEAGEGEQKIMRVIREKATGTVGALNGKRILVYGLDADLIVLSLLTMASFGSGVASWGLLREEIDGSKDGFGVLNIKELSGLLVPPEMGAVEYLRDYTCAMSFLGNDFLPHSLSVKLRENGHDLLCYRLIELHKAGKRLVGPDGKVSFSACADFVRPWSTEEEEWIAAAFDHKFKMRKVARSEVEKKMMPLEQLPLDWFAEGAIWRKGATSLIEGWRGAYQRAYLREAVPEEVCSEYMRGLQWIMDYYLGKEISYAWYFPWNVPPTWLDLLSRFDAGAEEKAPAVSLPVAPQEQLAMVLPMESWGLIRNPSLKVLPSLAPHMWPKSFGFFSVGRRWIWECEAEVPVISMERLRALLG